MWETVADALAAKMNSLKRQFNLRRHFRHNREGELHEETVLLQEIVFVSSTGIVAKLYWI